MCVSVQRTALFSTHSSDMKTNLKDLFILRLGFSFFWNGFGSMPPGKRGGYKRNQGEVYASLKVSSIKTHSGSQNLLLQISSQPFPSCADLLESAVILGRVP